MEEEEKEEKEEKVEVGKEEKVEAKQKFQVFNFSKDCSAQCSGHFDLQNEIVFKLTFQ